MFVRLFLCPHDSEWFLSGWLSAATGPRPSFACIARGAQLSLKRSPTRLPTNYPHDWHLDYGAPIG